MISGRCRRTRRCSSSADRPPAPGPPEGAPRPPEGAPRPSEWAPQVRPRLAPRQPVRLTENLPTTLALVERYPQGRFIIPHMGLRNGGTSRVLNALASDPNVYFDTSVVEPNKGMVERVGWQRVLLGSDAPTGSPARSVRHVRELGIPEEQVQAILGENAQRLFGL